MQKFIGSSDAALEFGRLAGRSIHPSSIVAAAKRGELQGQFTAGGRLLTTAADVARFAEQRKLAERRGG